MKASSIPIHKGQLTVLKLSQLATLGGTLSALLRVQRNEGESLAECEYAVRIISFIKTITMHGDGKPPQVASFFSLSNRIDGVCLLAPITAPGKVGEDQRRAFNCIDLGVAGNKGVWWNHAGIDRSGPTIWNDGN